MEVLTEMFINISKEQLHQMDTFMNILKQTPVVQGSQQINIQGLQPSTSQQQLPASQVGNQVYNNALKPLKRNLLLTVKSIIKCGAFANEEVMKNLLNLMDSLVDII